MFKDRWIFPIIGDGLGDGLGDGGDGHFSNDFVYSCFCFISRFFFFFFFFCTKKSEVDFP